jgi:hypothetical protein
MTIQVDVGAIQRHAEQWFVENVRVNSANPEHEAEFAGVKDLLRPIVVAAYAEGALWGHETALRQLQDDN